MGVWLGKLYPEIISLPLHFQTQDGCYWDGDADEDKGVGYGLDEREDCGQQSN